jgi:hypothetical protein
MSEALGLEWGSALAEPRFPSGEEGIRTVSAAVPGNERAVQQRGEQYGDERIARQLVAALPDAQLEVLPSAGHLCWFDDVDRVADRIRAHLLERAERRTGHTAATT